jgi:release factor glutamine methyltransferase
VSIYENVDLIEVKKVWGLMGGEKKELYYDLIIKLQNGYPLDYLLPYTTINGYKFSLNENVLIPRPETEQLLEIIEKSENLPETLIDVGTGGGFISICLSEVFENIIATDISAEALDVARSNIVQNNILNITTVESDLLEKVKIPSNDYWLVANLPYVPMIDKEVKGQNNVEYEPEIAIFADRNGLGLWYKLMKQLLKLETKPEKLFFELDSRNISEAGRFLDSEKIHYEIILDENQHLRFLIVDSF